MTPFGIVTVIRLVQPENVLSGISVNPEGSEADIKLPQPENMLFPKDCTVSGTAMLLIPEYAKALSPKEIRLLGSVTATSEVHPENACSPMLTTESGNVTEAKEESL